jgi:hypothetical protein
MAETLYNPNTGVTAIPTSNTTPDQVLSAKNMGFINPVPTTLDASRLGTSSPQNLPVTQPNTGGLNSTAGSVLGNAQNFLQSQQKASEALNTSSSGSSGDETLSYIKNLIGVESTKGDFTAGVQNEQDLSGKTKALSDINNEALMTAHSWDQQIQAAHTASGGLSGGADSTVAMLQMKRNEDLANIGIRQQVAQNNLKAAQDIIDSKVSTKFTPIENTIKYLNDYQQLKQNDLSESEKMKLQGQIDLQKSTLQFKQDSYKDALSQAAQNGAPQSVLSAIDKAAADPSSSPASIYSAAGKYAQSSTMFVQNGTEADIKPGTSQYKIAQDLAYGSITFSQFKSLYSYSRNTGQKQAIYQLASQLNPQFNPSSFELGFTMANNPKVRQQISALDNVQGIIPDILQASSDAARTNVTALNKAIIKGGILIGNSKYSNLQAAQVAFADELSGALGFGSATDMSREMGFNMADTSLSPQQFADALNNVVVPFVAQKRSSLLGQMGIYGNAINNMSNGGKPSAQSPSVSSDVQSILSKYGVKI